MKSIRSHTGCLLTLLAISAAPASFACTCAFPDVKTAVRQADLVFRGKLIRVQYLDPVRTVPNVIHPNRPDRVPRRFLATLEVSGVWKGGVGRTIVLHTREGASDCVGFTTVVGEDQLVFANEGIVTPKQPGVWRFPEWSDLVPVGQRIVAPGVCTLGGEAESAGKTLKQLGRSRKPD